MQHGNLLVDCKPIGGLRMVDNDEADDKIIAVLKNDAAYGSMREVAEIPPAILDRLRHYFLTYKQHPDSGAPACEVTHVYGRAEALEVVTRSLDDYRERLGDLESILTGALEIAR